MANYINRVSKKRVGLNREYSRRSKIFKELNPVCVLGLKLHAKLMKTTDCHHVFGRAGSLFLDERFWLPFEFKNHRWSHDNIAKAREIIVERDDGIRLPLIGRMGTWDSPERAEVQFMELNPNWKPE